VLLFFLECFFTFSVFPSCAHLVNLPMNHVFFPNSLLFLVSPFIGLWCHILFLDFSSPLRPPHYCPWTLPFDKFPFTPCLPFFPGFPLLALDEKCGVFSPCFPLFPPVCVVDRFISKKPAIFRQPQQIYSSRVNPPASLGLHLAIPQDFFFSGFLSQSIV